MTEVYAPDVALAQKCVSGDRAAQRELFERSRRRVHITLYRILGSNRDMEDLVQDAFLEIFRSLAGYRGEALLATWIDRVTARVAFAYLSRRKKLRTASLEVVTEVASQGPSAERTAHVREAARRLYTALDRVEARQRIAFTLHVIDGRPLKDVAETMNATLVATKTRVWRARRELQRRARKDPVLASFLDECGPRGGER